MPSASCNQLLRGADKTQMQPLTLSVVTRYTMANRGSFPVVHRSRDFSFAMSSRPTLGPTRPPNQRVKYIFSVGPKQPEREGSP